MNNKRRDPKTDEEWQLAVDAAEALLMLDSARQYGLVTGGPGVNRDRAEQILDRGARRGFHPSPDCLERLMAELRPDTDTTPRGRDPPA